MFFKFPARFAALLLLVSEALCDPHHPDDRMMLQLRNGDQDVDAEELEPSVNVQILIGDDFFNSDDAVSSGEVADQQELQEFLQQLHADGHFIAQGEAWDVMGQLAPSPVNAAI